MQTDAIAESSPATFEFPTDPAARAEFLKSGTLAEPKPEEAQPKGESAPPASAEPEKPAESAPAPAPGTQENGKAAKRLNEILEDLRRAGYTPAELKTLRRQAQADAKPPEKTEAEKPKPQSLEAPVKPKQEDFETWEKYQEAKDKYHEDFADYKAKLAVQQDRQERAEAEHRREAAAKIAEAKQRYGAEAEEAIREAATAINTGQGVSPVVQQMLIDSPVLADVLYVLGSKPEELQAFIELAKSNPGQALRKVVVLEQLVEQELSKGKAKPEPTETPERDETGKFKPTPKKVTAPPPPDELNTRGSPAPDPIEAAVKNDDFAAFKAEEDRRDLARRRGA